VTRWLSRLRVRQSETLPGLDRGEAEIKDLGGVLVANLPLSRSAWRIYGSGISRQCDFGLHPAAMTRGRLRQETLGDYLRVIRPYIELGLNPTLQRA